MTLQSHLLQQSHSTSNREKQYLTLKPHFSGNTRNTALLTVFPWHGMLTIVWTLDVVIFNIAGIFAAGRISVISFSLNFEIGRWALIDCLHVCSDTPQDHLTVLFSFSNLSVPDKVSYQLFDHEIHIAIVADRAIEPMMLSVLNSLLSLHHQRNFEYCSRTQYSAAEGVVISSSPNLPKHDVSIYTR